VLNKEKTNRNGSIPSETLIKYFQNIPVAAYYYQQLFPNNYQDRDELGMNLT
jgi:hypothetical protein